jgi:hypothetical protein
MSSFYSYFKENMEALGLPRPNRFTAQPLPRSPHSRP